MIKESRKTGNGILTVYTGPMMSGKTTSLIAELESEVEDNRSVMVIKPMIDNRFSDEDIISHDGISLQKETGYKVTRLGVNDVLSLESLEGIDVLLIDEAQFFIELSLNKVSEYLQHGIDVVAVGLDLDSDGKPFGSMPYLLSIANNVYKLTGVCTCCNEEATRTFRKLSAPTEAQILIGGKETYEPRCLTHWVEGNEEKKKWFN
jgi:thymidine kinase